MEQGKFYFALSKIPVDEDLTNEFKGHMNFTKEQVPPFATDAKFDRPTRQPISKTINAFLNSGLGGTIYLGIADDGRILGIMLNQYKMDHIIQNLNDVMSRYSPPVKSQRYGVRFVPVLPARASEQDIKNALMFDPSVGVDGDIRMNPHSLRSYRHCWCDKALAAQTANGVLCMQYVIEIHIKPWDPADVFNAGIAVGQMKAQPIHENEEGKAYYRGAACIREFTVSELQALASKVVLDHYQAIEKKLKDERSDLIRRLPSIVPTSSAN